MWCELGLDRLRVWQFGASRNGTHWDQVLFVLVAYPITCETLA